MKRTVTVEFEVEASYFSVLLDAVRAVADFIEDYDITELIIQDINIKDPEVFGKFQDAVKSGGITTLINR